MVARELTTPGLDSLPVLPTQLYEALGCLSIAAFCYFVLHPRKRFDGQVFVVAMALYALVRFFLEYLRADERGELLWFSTSQWIGLGMVAAMGALYVWLQRHAARRLASMPLPNTMPQTF